MLTIDFGDARDVLLGAGLVAAVSFLLLMLLHKRFAQAVLRALDEAIASCARLREKALHPMGLGTATPDGERESEGDGEEPLGKGGESSAVFAVLTRLLGLVVAGEVLLALYIIGASRTGLILFDGQAGSGLVQLPISIATVMGLLTWALGVTWLAVLFEVLGGERVPPSLQLLPPWLLASAGRIMRWVAWVGVALTFLYEALISLLAQARVLNLDFAGSQEATLLVAILQSVLALGAGGFSFFFVVAGIAALLAIVWSVVGLLLSLLRLALRPFERRVRPTGEDWEPEGAMADKTQWPKATAVGNAGAWRDQLPARVREAPYRTTIVAEGDFGLRLVPELLEVPGRLRPRGEIRAIGLCPTGRTPDRELGRRIRGARAKNIGITPAEYTAIRRRASGLAQQREQLLDLQFFKLMQHTPREAGEELVLVGLEERSVEAAARPLARFHGRHERSVVVLIIAVGRARRGYGATQQPEGPAEQRARLVETVERLHREGVIACAVLVDLEATLPGARRRDAGILGRGRHLTSDERWHLVARSLSGLLKSHVQGYDETLTGARVFADLGAEGPWVGLAVGSIGLEPGGTLSLLDPGRWRRGHGGGGAGRGDAERTRDSLQQLAGELLGDAGSWLFPVAPQPSATALVGEAFIPFPSERTGTHFLQVSAGLDQWLAREAPTSRLVPLAASGEPDGTVSTRYFGGWTWLYGLDHDEVLRALDGGRREANGDGSGSWKAAAAEMTEAAAFSPPTRNGRQGKPLRRYTPLNAPEQPVSTTQTFRDGATPDNELRLAKWGAARDHPMEGHEG